MTIDLSPALKKRVLREAKARGVKPKQVVEEALKIYFKPAAAARP
jgi:predicted transcriptional regulator